MNVNLKDYKEADENILGLNRMSFGKAGLGIYLLVESYKFENDISDVFRDERITMYLNPDGRFFCIG